MPRKEKEEDRIERIIRGLLKESDNRRCINCNSLGPQYICTTFWTFVCTNCSGVHREFSHRVKSVSVAKFKAEEISCLQTGGNERAREIYFKAWDPHRNFYPDGSNLYKLREFIKHVYIDRKYAGQNSSNKPNDPYELQPVKTSSFGEIMERPSFKRLSYSSEPFSPLKRNDERGFIKIFEERRSPRYIQENMRSSSHKKNCTTRFEIVDDRFREDGSKKVYDRSLSKESQSISRKMSLPAIQPVKEILGNKVLALRIGESPKVNDNKDEKDASRDQKAADSSNAASTSEKHNQEKTVNFNSLIDFDDNPEPQPQEKASNANTSEAPSSASEWADKAPYLNSVESLFELSDGVQSHSGAASALSNNSEATDITLSIPIMDKDQTLNDNSSNSMSLVTEKLNKSSASTDGPKTGGRKELPADLFASHFAPFNPVAPAWQMRPPHEIGFGRQFHPAVMSVTGFPNRAKPSNPFDIADDGPQIQVPTLPSMTLSATALQPQQSPSGTALSSHVSPYGINAPPFLGAYMGPQPNNMVLTRPQGIASFGSGQDAFASLNPIQQGTGTDSSPSALNSSFSHGRNPFG